MFETLSERLGASPRPADPARCAVGGRRQRGDARGAPRADRGRRRARRGALVHRQGARQGRRRRTSSARSRRARWSSRSSTTSSSRCSAPDAEPIDLNAPAPVPLMLVGLQGSGKTTTAAKIAKRLTEREKRKVLMASLDTRRPAAQEQLRVLGAAGRHRHAADRRRPDAGRDRRARA